MRITKDTGAISVLLMILLLLCSAILGGLASYLWVMSSYYNMPENPSLLVVENVNFPIGNFSYFNVTVLNPSNSASDANITAFNLTVQETNETYSVMTTEYPEPLPFLLAIGTRQTFKCIENWGSFAGDTVRIEPVANASAASTWYVTPSAKLVITPSFDPSAGVQNFSLTVENPAESAMNLTVSDVRIFSESINATPTLSPYTFVVAPNTTQVFRCDRNWEDLRGLNITVTVETLEGYESSYETTILGAAPYVADVSFDYADSTYFNVTIGNSEDATVPATISSVNVIFQNGTVYSPTTRFPPLNTVFSSVYPNRTVVFECAWAWTQDRSADITVDAYTKEGFTVSNMTARTPPSIAWNMTSVNFDLDDLGHFVVNVTNALSSLNSVDVSMIQLNDQNTTLSPSSTLLHPGENATLACAIDWTNLIGQSVSVTAITDDGMNISTTVTLPALKLELSEEAAWEKSPIPYVNITVTNSNNSLANATLVEVAFGVGNQTYKIDGNLTNPSLSPNGNIVTRGNNLTISCPWNWISYPDSDLTITVHASALVLQTSVDLSVSQSFKIPEYTP